MKHAQEKGATAKPGISFQAYFNNKYFCGAKKSSERADLRVCNRKPKGSDCEASISFSGMLNEQIFLRSRKALKERNLRVISGKKGSDTYKNGR